MLSDPLGWDVSGPGAGGVQRGPLHRLGLRGVALLVIVGLLIFALSYGISHQTSKSRACLQAGGTYVIELGGPVCLRVPQR